MSNGETRCDMTAMYPSRLQPGFEGLLEAEVLQRAKF